MVIAEHKCGMVPLYIMQKDGMKCLADVLASNTVHSNVTSSPEVSLQEPSKKCGNPWKEKDPCAYAKENCDFDSVLMNALGFYYCRLYRSTIKIESRSDADTFATERLKGNRGSLFGYCILMLPLLLIFFLILYLTANDHLTPSLGLMSNWLGLSPTVAGVTLLAFGNGAPDFFTSLLGTEEIEMVPLILGGAIGSGLFITCFVFGLVILAQARKQDFAKLKKERNENGDDSTLGEAQLNNSWWWRVGGWRKVIRAKLKSKKPENQIPLHMNEIPGEATNKNAALETNTPIRSDTPLSQKGKIDSSAKLDIHKQANASTSSFKAPSLVASIRSAQAGHFSKSPRDTSLELPVSNQRTTAADSLIDLFRRSGSDKIFLLNPFSSTKHFLLYFLSILLLVLMASIHFIPLVIPIFMVILYVLNICSVIGVEIYRFFQGKKLAEKRDCDLVEGEDCEEPSNEKAKKLDLTLKQVIIILWKQWKINFNGYSTGQKVFAMTMMPIQILVYLTIPPLFISDKDHLDDSDLEEFTEENDAGKNTGNNKINPDLTQVSELPESRSEDVDENISNITYTPASEIDLNEDTKSRPTILEEYFYVDRFRLVANPLFSLPLIFTSLHLWNVPIFGISQLPIWVVFLAISPWISFFIYLSSSYRRPPLYRPFLVVIAFVICIVWIYGISGEIVNLFQGLGVLFPTVSPAFLGLTVLAWGNSFGDLVVDVAIVASLSNSRGAFETAFTGIICGPLQNVLLSLGICFIKLVLSNNPANVVTSSSGFFKRSLYIKADPTLYFSMSLLLLMLLISFFVLFVLWRFQRVERWYGYFLISIYLIVFLPVATLGGIGVFPYWNVAF